MIGFKAMAPLVKIALSGLACSGLLYPSVLILRRGGFLVGALLLLAVTGAVFATCRSALVPRHADAEQRCQLLTGDEPDYLLTALSLAQDHDINIANNLAAEQYRWFQSRPVGGGDFDFFNRISQGRIARHRAEWGEARYMQHRFGISVVIAPVFLLAREDFRWWAYVLISSLLSGFTVLAWRMACRSGVDGGWAGVVCAGSVLAAPVLFYANQVYPEAVAGCLLAAGALAVMQGGGASWAAVPCLMAVVWFSDRALPPAAVLMVLVVARLPSWRQRLPALALLGGSVVAFSLYCHHRFGLPVPISHNEVFDCSVAAVPRRFFQILFDGMQGWVWLFPPVLLLPAVMWSLARQRPFPVVGAGVLLGLLLALAMVAAFGDWRGGTNPRGRYYVIPQLLLVPLWFSWLRGARGGSATCRRVGLAALLAVALLPLPWLTHHPEWWYRGYHPFFGWEPIQRYYGIFPSLPDGAPWQEWLKLLAWLPFLALPSLACILIDERERSREQVRPVSPRA